MFICCDKKCPGQHLVHQPIGKGGLYSHLRTPSDVQFVEPYLLPCTVCKQSPPKEYQTEMFALEARLPELTAQFAAEHAEIVTKSSEGCCNVDEVILQCQDLLARIEQVGAPPMHRLSEQLLVTAMQVAGMLPEFEFSNDKLKTAIACVTFLRTLENQRSDSIAGKYCAVSEHLERAHVANFVPIALQCAQKALRMHLILNGREARIDWFDERVAEAMRAWQNVRAGDADRPYFPRLPEASDGKGADEKCAFCNECEGCAALNLHHGAQGAEHMYCSQGCEQAHLRVEAK